VKRSLEELEQRLGVSFSDRALLLRALTHPSYSLEHGGDDYERLEFLGDSILGWVVATHLFAAFPALDEGSLTRMKVALTSGRTLAEVAREIDLGPWILFGRGAVREATRDSVLENVFESLCGAVYLESGAEAARAFVLRWLDGRVDPDALLATVADPKSRLQEHTQGLGLGLPVYEIVDRSGPAHDPRFTATVRVGAEILGSGEGGSKQDAQQAAAVAALTELGSL
jgi:ribonuclease III